MPIVLFDSLAVNSSTVLYPKFTDASSEGLISALTLPRNPFSRREFGWSCHGWMMRLCAVNRLSSYGSIRKTPTSLSRVADRKYRMMSLPDDTCTAPSWRLPYPSGVTSELMIGLYVRRLS